MRGLSISNGNAANLSASEPDIRDGNEAGERDITDGAVPPLRSFKVALSDAGASEVSEVTLVR